jgi:metallo-beta-lactamase family protein
VRAEIVVAEAFSAHADAHELIAWLRECKPPNVAYVVHGEPDASTTLCGRLVDELGWNATVPSHGERVLVR